MDEFQNFATESFAAILSEARKYRLSLILAHQYITQMEENVRDAVFGNVGTLIAFRVGGQDAEFLKGEFGHVFRAEDIVELPFAHIYLRLMVDGMTSHAFSAQTLPPFPRPEQSHGERIIELSRRRYAARRREVEEHIARWSGRIEAVESQQKLREPGEIPKKAAREPGPQDVCLSLKEALRRKPISLKGLR